MPARDRRVAIETPVRPVGREEQHPLGADLVEQPREPALLRRALQGLEGDAHMLADQVGGRALHPGHLGAQAAPGLVRAPQEVRQPADAGVEQHHAQAGELAEDALVDEAQQLPLEHLRLARMVLGVEGGPAGRGRRVAVGAAGVDRHRQAEALRRAPDRAVHPPAQRRFGHRRQQHGHEAPVRRQALDLLRRQVRRLRRHDDGGAQPRLGVQPFARDPIVHRAAQGDRHVLRGQRRRAPERVADRDAGAERRPGPGRAAAPGSRRACRSPGANRAGRRSEARAST